MGWLSNLIGGAGAAGAGQVVKDAGEAVGGLAKDIRTAITGIDPDKAAEIEKLTLEMEKAVVLAQSSINEKEAQSARFFVAGWRPFIGWLCGSILALHYMVRPIGQWVISAAGSALVLPAFDLSEIWPVLIAMLGLGGMRSFEKAKGVQATH